MGLFDKKICDLCGSPIKFLGNFKLADGNMCKDCAGKCSPFLNGRKSYTVAQTREHLDYRERNNEILQNFSETRTFGFPAKFFFDDSKGQWLVNTSGDYRSNNADVFTFDQVTGCNVDIEEYKRQITETPVSSAPGVNQRNINTAQMHGAGGRGPQDNRQRAPQGNPLRHSGGLSPDNVRGNSSTVRQNTPPPPVRYEYTYDVFLNITLKHPWVETIRVKVNSSAMDRDDPAYSSAAAEADDIRTALLSQTVSAAQAAAQGPVNCPNCGAVTTPTGNGCCEYCGCKIN